MRPSWLVLLLVLALLLPGTRPRLIGATMGSAIPISNSSPSQTNSETESEEEEHRDNVASSRFRLTLGANRSLDKRTIPQFKRFSRSLPPAASITLQSENGFGGHIVC